MSAGRTLGELLAPLIAARRVLEQQLQREICALQAACELDAEAAPKSDVVLALYLGLGGAKAAAQHCNAQGWRLPGVAKESRRWAPDDVYAVVRSGQPADPALRAIALARLAGTAPKPFAGYS